MISVTKLSIFFFLAIAVVVIKAEKAEKAASNDCFPADATVVLEDGTVKAMNKLAVGDRVSVGRGKFSEVFLFTHSEKGVVSTNYVQLTVENGEELVLSEGHYLPISGSLKAASAVEVGDFVTLGSGMKSKITNKISNVEKTGLFNPQTLNGNIVVNGVLASTFTLAADPKLSQAALSPLRACFLKFGGYSFYFNQGVVSYWGKMLGAAGKSIVA